MPPQQEPSEHEQEKIERLRRAMYSRTLSENLHERPRRPLDPDINVVGEDFERTEKGAPGSVVAPRTLGLARKILWWILAASVLFCVAAIAFFGYYFLFGPGSGDTSSNNIDIVVTGPPQIQGGTATEFQVTVTNRNRQALELADLVITFPSGTKSPADFTTDEPTLQQSLGTIEPGASQQGTVSVVLSGNAGDTADIKVELDYHLGGSSAIFVASTDYPIVFSSSPLSIAVDGDTETTSGQPVQMTVSVNSNVGEPVNGVLLQADYPFGFNFTSSTPPPTSSGFWQLGDLAPGAKDTITINGTLSGSQGDSRVFHFTAGTSAATSSSASIDTTLADETFSMAISQPFLGLDISTNGATSSSIVVTPGSSVTVSIAWHNNLPVAITDASIVAQLNGIPIDGSTVLSSNGFYRSSDGVVLWDKSTDPDLASLAPGANGVVSFSFQIPSADALNTTVNPVLDISVSAAGDRVSETGVPESLQAAADQKIAISSNLNLTAQGLYYSNPFGSTGPMPPKADTETTYALVLTVTNSTSEISNAYVTATLPPYVRWVGIYNPSSENVYFDGKLYTNGQILPAPSGDPCQGATGICWDLGDIPAGTGINGANPRQVAIGIGFTPSESQIGQKPDLVQNIQIWGIDAAKAAAQLAADPGATIVPQLLGTTNGNLTTNLTLVPHTSDNAGVNYVGDPGFSVTNATVVSASQ